MKLVPRLKRFHFRVCSAKELIILFHWISFAQCQYTCAHSALDINFSQQIAICFLGFDFVKQNPPIFFSGALFVNQEVCNSTCSTYPKHLRCHHSEIPLHHQGQLLLIHYCVA